MDYGTFCKDIDSLSYMEKHTSTPEIRIHYFQHATLKSWAEPGDEATRTLVTCIE